MPTITRASGLRLEIPETVRVAEPAAPPATSVRRRRSTTRAAGAAPPDTDPVVQALEAQELELVDAVPLEPAPQPAIARRRTRAASAGRVTLDLAVGDDEDAVLLLEQDGVYSWNLPTEAAAPAVRRRRRGGAAAEAGPRRVVFQIELAAPAAPAEGGRRRTRGLLQDLIVDRVKAYVFKFAARVFVGAAMKHLERNVERGLVVLNGYDPAGWQRVRDFGALSLPRDRQARILLFVHGTFSSTRGSYGALGSTPRGRALLDAARSSYDAVVGFDHHTLSETPLENARELLQQLRTIEGQYPPHIDVVAFSRGGLVFRSLVEQVLPGEIQQPRFGRAIFVGVPNGGTPLALARNWRTFIDLYTNLAVAAFRLLQMLPQATSAAVVLKELIQGLAALVKHIVAHATEEAAVPGLAAQSPESEFIKTLNQAQTGQPAIEQTNYCAITSEFRAQLFGGDHRPQEFPRRLVQTLLDAAGDQLMGAASDLVVATSSMVEIDLALGSFIKQRLDFGLNPRVYHTCYFLHDEVVDQMARWLDLSLPETAAEAPRRLGARSSVPPSAPVLPAGGVVAAALPEHVDTNIFVISARASVDDARDAIRAFLPRYLVVRRVESEHERYDYAFTSGEVVERLSGAGPDRQLIDALHLHETDASERRTVADPAPAGRGHSAATVNRAVVLDGDRPVGVVPAPEEQEQAPTFFATIDDSLELWGGVGTLGGEEPVAGNGSRGPRRMRSRRNGGGTRAPVGSGAPAETPARQPALCHFLAEMDDELLLDKVSSVEVVVSREEIERGMRASAGGSAVADPARQIIVQVIPRANVDNEDEGRAAIDVPEPGQPARLLFDIRATHPGDVEVDVVARQGQVALVTLKLRGRVVEARGERTRARAEATTPDAAPLKQPVHQLRIFDLREGDAVVYQYYLESQELQLFNSYRSRPIVGDREAYVRSLYKKVEEHWISSREDVEDFTGKLRAYGGQLFDELFPPELQKDLWTHRTKIKSIQVISPEPFIPWELVHLKQPNGSLPRETRFLGMMGVVRWLHDAGWPPDRLQVRPGRARYVIPHYPDPRDKLPEAEQEAAFLEQQFGATAVEPEPRPVRELLAQPGAFDLLHFACHGEGESDNITDAHLLMQGRMENGRPIETRLEATEVEQWSRLQGRDGIRPVVVLNACRAGRAGYKLTGIGGFSQAFLRKGAGAFVGTLWSVSDAPARTFTETFYRRLLAGDTVSDAAIKARAAARKDGDSTWLAYVVYAHPHATLLE